MRYFTFITLILLSGCAQMQQDWIAQHCNTQTAYSQGVNDARHDQDMQPSYAAGCPTTPDKINQAYRQGYQFVLANQPPSVNITTSTAHKKYECHDQFNQQICGYDCKTFAGKWTCAQKANQQCIQNMSDIKCGYHCQKDNFGNISCKTKP
ncbi:hypothetical protein [Shewanella surugensis]|uniref:Lipoprotein n=1 Tax=Shewanella surugensis TaxID=212020 RepID=A0ABT0LFY9_9GAMM|nr:hypothetical protein [Shewanella surugensis]MCL1126583.1 hypothetical protein [Shewanella surugensis]